MNRSTHRQIGSTPGQRSFPSAVGLFLCAMATLATGCASLNPFAGTPPTVVGSDRPDNIYLAGPTLPHDVKRVAVLPLMVDERYAELIEGREALDPLLTVELIKTERFEITRVTPESLRDCTGRPGWTGEEALPPEIFASLRAAYGCDAVLFCQLTEYRAYAPMAVGWRMKLVDAQTRQILWAGDELFEAAPKPVHAKKAFIFPRLLQPEPGCEDLSAGWIAQTSPRRFGQYTVAQLLATLPDR